MGQSSFTPFEEETFQHLRKKMGEQADLTPQNLGFLTSPFKRFSPFLKNSPWKIFIPLAFLFSVGAFFLFGNRVVHLTSILQRGF